MATTLASLARGSDDFELSEMRRRSRVSSPISIHLQAALVQDGAGCSSGGTCTYYVCAIGTRPAPAAGTRFHSRLTPLTPPHASPDYRAARARGASRHGACWGRHLAARLCGLGFRRDLAPSISTLPSHLPSLPASSVSKQTDRQTDRQTSAPLLPNQLVLSGEVGSWYPFPSSSHTFIHPRSRPPSSSPPGGTTDPPPPPLSFTRYNQ